MKPKTFCFNKTIFKKNLTHFWPLWVLYLIYLICVLPVKLWLNMQSYMSLYGYSQSECQINAICDTMGLALKPFVIFGFAVTAIMAVFSYLFSAKSTNMIHALPVNRRELFVTNIGSAAIFMIVPEIITFFITVFVCISAHITSIEYILFWLGSVVSMTLFALALGVFVAMFTGQLLAVPFYFVIVNYLYVGCRYMINMIIECICYGVSDEWNPGKSCILSPLYYLNNNLRVRMNYDENYNAIGMNATGGYLIVVYAVVAVVLLFAAYWLYKRRQLETAGDVISMRGMKPVFRWGVGICVGILFGVGITDMVIYQMTGNIDSFPLLFACVLAVEFVSFFAAEMLMQKNFRVFRKKIVAEWAVLAVISAGLLGMFKLDVFHIERKIPNASDVSTVIIDMDYRIKYKKEEDIQKIIDIHKQIIDQKQASISAKNVYPAEIIYQLKNGEKIKRFYSIPVEDANIADTDSLVSQILKIESEPEHMIANIFGENYKTNEYYAGNIQFVDETGKEDEYRFSGEEIDRIVDAVFKDVEEGNMNEYQLYSMSANDDESYLDDYYNSLVVSFFNPNGIKWNYDYMDEYTDVATSYYPRWGNNSEAYIGFGPNCTHLVETLEELGIVNDERKLLTYAEYNQMIPTDAGM